MREGRDAITPPLARHGKKGRKKKGGKKKSSPAPGQRQKRINLPRFFSPDRFAFVTEALKREVAEMKKGRGQKVTLTWFFLFFLTLSCMHSLCLVCLLSSLLLLHLLPCPFSRYHLPRHLPSPPSSSYPLPLLSSSSILIRLTLPHMLPFLPPLPLSRSRFHPLPFHPCPFSSSTSSLSFFHPLRSPSLAHSLIFYLPFALSLSPSLALSHFLLRPQLSITLTSLSPCCPLPLPSP